MRRAKGLLWVAGLAVGMGATAGCSSDKTTGGTHVGGEGGGGSTAGEAVGQGGARAGAGDVGGAGASGEASCDCGTDVNAATIPLACACDAGLCSTFADDLATYQRPGFLAEPNYVLLGTCDDGYRTLRYEEASEQVRRRTYAADGRMVYDDFGGYGPIAMPKSCGFTEHLSLGSSTVGEDPSKNCSYCLVTASDEPVGAGGAGGGASGSPYYPESLTAPCDAALLE